MRIIPEVEDVIESPQQTPGSVDCGVIICEIIAHIFQHTPIGKECDSVKARARLVNVFLNRPGNSFTKEGYEALQLARKFQFQQD